VYYLLKYGIKKPFDPIINSDKLISLLFDSEFNSKDLVEKKNKFIEYIKKTGSVYTKRQLAEMVEVEKYVKQRLTEAGLPEGTIQKGEKTTKLDLDNDPQIIAIKQYVEGIRPMESNTKEKLIVIIDKWFEKIISNIKDCRINIHFDKEKYPNLSNYTVNQHLAYNLMQEYIKGNDRKDFWIFLTYMVVNKFYTSIFPTGNVMIKKKYLDASTMQTGGNDYHKYLKYKNKYQQLKQKINFNF
jgi:hypothetical protein